MTIQILQNILRFLERVDVKGIEAYALAEAHNHVRDLLDKLASEPVKAKIAEGIEAGLKDLTAKVNKTEPESATH
jgi:hypothetical protein